MAHDEQPIISIDGQAQVAFLFFFRMVREGWPGKTKMIKKVKQRTLTTTATIRTNVTTSNTENYI